MTATPGPVWDVVNGLAGHAALAAALELGLVELLADGDRTATELAAATGAREPDDVVLLAELLVALGLLTATGDRFGLTPVAQRFLLRGSPVSMAALAPLSAGPWSGWQGLADRIRTGAPAAGTTAELDAAYPALVQATAPTQRAVAARVVAALRDRGLLPEAATVVDLGCGSGAWLTTVLAADPRARGIGVDLPGVAAVARAAATEHGLGGRLEVLEGDYLDVALPVGRADVVVLAHVLRAEPPDRARRLVARALGLVAPDGVLVVADYPRPDPPGPGAGDRTAELVAARHELVLSLTMAAATAGRGLSLAELGTWAAAGGGSVVAHLQPVPRQTVLLLRPDGHPPALAPAPHPHRPDEVTP